MAKKVETVESGGLTRAEKAALIVRKGSTGKSTMEEVCKALEGLTTDELEYVSFATRQPISRLVAFQQAQGQSSLDL